MTWKSLAVTFAIGGTLLAVMKMFKKEKEECKQLLYILVCVNALYITTNGHKRACMFNQNIDWSIQVRLRQGSEC